MEERFLLVHGFWDSVHDALDSVALTLALQCHVRYAFECGGSGKVWQRLVRLMVAGTENPLQRHALNDLTSNRSCL